MEGVPLSLRVECYAGHRADERPLALWLDGRRVAVREVVDRWLGEDHAYFKVIGEDGLRYLLRRDDGRNCWELIRVEVPTTPSTEVRT
jgi:hypothetical protein